MKTIAGKFFKSDGSPVGANCKILLQLTAPFTGAEITVLETGEKRNWPQDFSFWDEIQLTEQGCIPEGTTILGNDEVEVSWHGEVSEEGTTYDIRVMEEMERRMPDGTLERWTEYHYMGELTLAGPEPICLNDLDPQLAIPAPPPPPKPQARLAAPRHSRRSTKPTGIFAGISDPGDVDAKPTSIFFDPRNAGPRDTNGGLFGAAAFTVPRRTVVNRASIFVNVPSPIPGLQLVIAFYELASREKLSQVGIDVSTREGTVASAFPEITLEPGREYAYAWATDKYCNVLRVSGWEYKAPSKTERVIAALTYVPPAEPTEPILTEGVGKGCIGGNFPETLPTVRQKRCGARDKFIDTTQQTVQISLPELPPLLYLDAPRSVESAK